MSIYSDTVNGILLLRPNQDVDSEVARDIQERLDVAANDDIVHVILDFSLTDLVSTATLRILLETARLMERRRGCLAVTGASQQFRHLLEISDVLKIVLTFHTLEEAQAHIFSSLGQNDSFLHAEDSDV